MKEAKLTSINLHTPSTEDEVTRSIEIEEISNGYLVSETLRGPDDNGEWFHKTTRKYHEQLPDELKKMVKPASDSLADYF